MEVCNMFRLASVFLMVILILTAVLPVDKVEWVQ